MSHRNARQGERPLRGQQTRCQTPMRQNVGAHGLYAPSSMGALSQEINDVVKRLRIVFRVAATVPQLFPRRNMERIQHLGCGPGRKAKLHANGCSGDVLLVSTCWKAKALLKPWR